MPESTAPLIAPLIQLVDLTRVFDAGGVPVPVLNGVSLKIEEGEFVAIMGQSGSGKSTLMNIIGCLDRPSGGRYLFCGRDVSRLESDDLAELRRNTFGFIFQRYNLIANETATENVEIPSIYAGMSRRDRITRARELLVRLGLADRLDYRPTQLSGGQQQRVSIARALMNGGRVILADEPTGALDSRSGADVMAQLHELHRAGHTIILITHDGKVAAEADRTIQLRDGLIVEDAVVRERSAQVAPLRAPPSTAGGPAASHLPDILEAMKMALRSLRTNLFRTVLTLLGIIIGVGAVVAMLAIGDGSKASVLSRIEAMGTDLLVVRPGARNVRTPGDSATLVPEDADAIAALANVRESVPEYGSGVTVRYQESDYTTTGTGTSANYARARNWELAEGAFFADGDVTSYAPVVVLGRTVANNLFRDGESPLGKYVLVNNIPFQVVGVLAAKGATAFGSDMDDNMFVPLTTARMRLFGRRFVRAITVQVADVARGDETEKAITDLLTERHRKVDFQIRNMSSLLETATETQNTLTVLLGSIAAISLLVGGIGVMNIMLVSVTERVREIGIRMATGARMIHILLQFITEALVVCAVGGVVGVLGGLGVAWIARQFGTPVVFSLPPVVLAFSSAFVIGVLFGFLPARRAARLDPVVALSSE
ncbi:MAG: MacB family efflux pump subunit [Sterolibacteriaceae bacterium]|nr:MacB family efflux pump subunit [Candidatus Methylophosphatis haderslevensis]